MIWLFWQVRQTQLGSGELITQLLEYSALFAIMLLAILALYRERKSGLKHSRDQASELRELTERCVAAIERSTAALEELTKEIRRSNDKQ